MKIRKAILRKDLQPDHAHTCPDGKMTGGELLKPNANARAGWHTHLFQHDGMTYETDAAYYGPDHVHDVPEFGGFTSGPMPVPKHYGEELERLDSLQREGTEWVLRSGKTGKIIGRGKTRVDALHLYADADSQDVDEAMIKDIVGHDVDEGIWEKAKHASQEGLGKVKWPFVMWWYKQHGGN